MRKTEAEKAKEARFDQLDLIAMHHGIEVSKDITSIGELIYVNQRIFIAAIAFAVESYKGPPTINGKSMPRHIIDAMVKDLEAMGVKID